MYVKLFCLETLLLSIYLDEFFTLFICPKQSAVTSCKLLSFKLYDSLLELGILTAYLVQ